MFLLYFRIHERAHTGVKPYSCDECGQQFSQKGNLRTHTRIAHAGNPKDFKCDLCDKTFNSKAYLKLHHKFHKGTIFNCIYKLAVV